MPCARPELSSLRTAQATRSAEVSSLGTLTHLANAAAALRGAVELECPHSPVFQPMAGSCPQRGSNRERRPFDPKVLHGSVTRAQNQGDIQLLSRYSGNGMEGGPQQGHGRVAEAHVGTESSFRAVAPAQQGPEPPELPWPQGQKNVACRLHRAVLGLGSPRA